MVVCEPNDLDEVFQDRPVVIFEVLSESTARTDCEEKLRAYQTIPTLRAYAVVESERVGITCYAGRTLPRRGRAERFEQRDGSLPLPGVDCALSIEALHARSGL